jgi:D-alanyl-D-alanine carboxypeptidase
LAAALDGTLLPNNYTSLNPSWAWSAGAGISTARDLARWSEAIVTDELLCDDVQKERIDSVMNVEVTDPEQAVYGLALAKFGPVLGHTGELPGFNTFMGSDPTEGITLVVWANLAPSPYGTDPAVTIAKELIEKIYG